MKKWLCVLAMVSVNATAANWQPVASNDQAELAIDVASINDTKHLRTAWSMWNFKEARNNGDTSFPTLKSYQDLHEYNCKDQSMRLAREIIYAESNGQGASRDHTDALKNMPFSKPEANSLAEVMLQLVCGYTIPTTAPATPAKK
jgi:hypothetical protein